MWKWECCIVEWLWDGNTIRCNMPDGAESHERGSYPQVVEILTRLGSEGWEVATCSGTANWLLWTLKRCIV